MTHLTKSTQSISEKDIVRKWHLIDVKGKIVGRVSSEIVQLLTGKGKKMFVPNLDCGDYVVVINAKHVRLTGRKDQSKVYSRYSGYPGGMMEISFEQMLERRPTEIIRLAVSGMLPKNKLRDKRLAKLFVFADEHHSYKDKLEVKSK